MIEAAVCVCAFVCVCVCVLRSALHLNVCRPMYGGVGLAQIEAVCCIIVSLLQGGDRANPSYWILNSVWIF